jgi:immunoglobulin-binding protein 1
VCGFVHRYHELEAAGEEDNEMLVDAAVYKDRDWDAWKEDNPKGSGNKMNKKF